MAYVLNSNIEIDILHVGISMIYIKNRNNIHRYICIVWDEITYPFPNFNGATVEVWEWISSFMDMWLLIHAGVKVKPC